MEDLFIPFDLAIKLQQKGFDNDCLKFYDSNQKLVSDFSQDSVPAPLFQQANDWLRDFKGINIYIKLVRSNSKYLFFVEHPTGTEHGPPYDTYYMAWRNGISIALQTFR